MLLRLSRSNASMSHMLWNNGTLMPPHSGVRGAGGTIGTSLSQEALEIYRPSVARRPSIQGGRLVWRERRSLRIACTHATQTHTHMSDKAKIRFVMYLIDSNIDMHMQSVQHILSIRVLCHDSLIAWNESRPPASLLLRYPHQPKPRIYE